MGNAQSSSKTKDKTKLPGIIDTIASHYILTQDFEDMTKLENQEYCNKLVVLTSNIISERLTDLEIVFLSQRTKQGNTIDEMSSDRVLILKDTLLKKLDIQNSIKKKRVCIGIAKFYIKIAHLFAAIVGTLNPVYSYKGNLGKTEKVPFLKRTHIPSELKSTAKMSKINICSSRINSIIMEELKLVDSDDTKFTLKPKFCSMNTKNKTSYKKPAITATVPSAVPRSSSLRSISSPSSISLRSIISPRSISSPRSINSLRSISSPRSIISLRNQNQCCKIIGR